MVGHGESSASSYLTDPTSPIPYHCASIVVTSTLSVKNECNLCLPVSLDSLHLLKLRSSLPHNDISTIISTHHITFVSINVADSSMVPCNIKCSIIYTVHCNFIYLQLFPDFVFQGFPPPLLDILQLLKKEHLYKKEHFQIWFWVSIFFHLT